MILKMALADFPDPVSLALANCKPRLAYSKIKNRLRCFLIGFSLILGSTTFHRAYIRLYLTRVKRAILPVGRQMKRKKWASKKTISDFCHEHNLLSRWEYEQAYKNGKLPKDFPAKPAQALGEPWGQILWVPVETFKLFCKQHGIISLKHYQELYETNQLPPRFPPNPRNAYNCPIEHLGWQRTDIKKAKKV
jgi:hypothetical protein